MINNSILERNVYKFVQCFWGGSVNHLFILYLRQEWVICKLINKIMHVKTSM